MMLNHILSETAVYHHCHQGLMKPLQHSCAQSEHILPCPHPMHQRQAHGNSAQVDIPHLKHPKRASRQKHSMQSSTGGVSGAGMSSMSMSEVSPPSNTTDGSSASLGTIASATKHLYKHVCPGSTTPTLHWAGRPPTLLAQLGLATMQDHVFCRTVAHPGPVCEGWQNRFARISIY